MFAARGPHRFLPEDVLPDSRESWDVLVVDDVGVQRGLRHQVRLGQRWVHQGEPWEKKSVGHRSSKNNRSKEQQWEAFNLVCLYSLVILINSISIQTEDDVVI